jgi:hypothetical protein
MKKADQSNRTVNNLQKNYSGWSVILNEANRNEESIVLQKKSSGLFSRLVGIGMKSESDSSVFNWNDEVSA